MARNSTPSAAGGVLIAGGAIAGVVLGEVAGEPTVGLLGGLAAGIAIASLLWWRERG